MTIIAYSETTSSDVEFRLGKSEYSYYFVLKEFLPVLEALDRVVVVTDPAREVDPVFDQCRKNGDDCVFLTFAPPYLTELGLACPTVPVFAWEFETIPNETWYGERQQDWRYVLDRLGRAITHSETTVRTIKAVMGPDFPVVSIPAPVWDRFAAQYEPGRSAVVEPGTRLSVLGMIIDSRTFDFSPYEVVNWYPKGAPPELFLEPARKTETQIALDGVVYLSIFNPADARKNWHDMISGFCWAFRNTEDATLVLKLTSYDGEVWIAWMLDFIARLTPFSCRILILTGFLRDEQYEALIRDTSYVVNSSQGEGQCLPLMEAMARGKPVIAPRHTGMADYINSENAFVVRSSGAPTLWPHDPRVAFRTLHQRINFDSLVEAYCESYRVAKEEPQRYARMGEQARESMRRHASVAVIADRLRNFLRTPPRASGPDDRYGQITTRPEVSRA